MTARPTASSLRPVVFLTSFCTLALEIMLTRAFAVILWQHLVFMAVSIALLGYAAGGSFLAVLPIGRRRPDVALFSLLALFPCLILAAGWISFRLPFDPVTLLWDPASLLRLALLHFVLSVPFLGAGLVMSLCYSLHPERSGSLYFFDLLGGASGALAGPLLFAESGGRGLPLLAALAALGPLVASFGTASRRLIMAAPPMMLAAWFLWPSQALIPRPNPYKDLSQALYYEGASIIKTGYDNSARADLVRSPAARGAPGLSLNYRGEPGEALGVSIDGGQLTPVYPEGPGSTRVHRWLPTYLPYYLGRRKAVLVEDSRGGLPLLAAVDHGAALAVAAEPHSLAWKLVRSTLPRFRRWAGAEGVRAEAGWARNYLARRGGEFDLIEISLFPAVGAASTGLMPSFEDYRLTGEALLLYLRHLAPEGICSLSTYLLPPPRTEGRLMATAVEAMEEEAGPGFRRHMLVVRSFNTLSIFLKKSPFSEAELALAKEFCESMAFDLVWYDGVSPEEQNIHNVFPKAFYERLFADLLEPASRAEIYRRGVFDLRPVSDESPFFFGFLKTRTLEEAARSLRGRLLPLFQSGLILWLILAQAAVIAFVTIILPLFPAVGQGGRGAIFVIPYFAVLGLAYLLLEMAWIQKLTLALGRPALAASLVIAVMLLFSGLGSLWLGRKPPGYFRSRRAPVMAGAAGLAATLALWLMARDGSNLFLHPYAALALVAPASVFMGVPFPLGLRRLSRRPERIVPWAWAVNGCFSVLGAAAAPVLASAIGYSAAAATGGALYLLAAWIYPRLPGRG